MAVKKKLKSLSTSFGNLLQAHAIGHVPLFHLRMVTNIYLPSKQQSVSDACNHMTFDERQRLESLSQLQFLHVYSSGWPMRKTSGTSSGLFSPVSRNDALRR